MRPKPPLASVAVNALRRAQGMSEEDVSERAGISERMVGHYMTGKLEPKGEVMDKLVSGMGYDPGSDQPVRRALERVCSPGEEPRSPVDPTAEEQRAVGRVATLAGLGVAAIAEESAVRFIRGRRAARGRRRADRLWGILKGCTPQRRRLLIEKAKEYQRWYVAERLAHESETAASHQPALALELATLALRAAELSGTDEFRAEVIGYVLLFVGNAQRVQGDLHESDASFARARKLLEAGAAADPGIFAAWRLPDLEASLRRAQRRFEEALTLHDEALALGPEAAGRILVKKAYTLEQKGDAEGAVEVLREAAPRVEREGDRSLLFALLFNRTAIFCDIEKPAEAEELLPQVRELAFELGQEIHLVRLRWLAARIHSGLGRTKEAIADLESVVERFAGFGMAYDCALASVKLSALYLKEDRTPEVKALARWMEQVFRRLKIHREALAAITLFCQAVQKETATAGLAERLFSYLQRARRMPELQFQER